MSLRSTIGSVGFDRVDRDEALLQIDHLIAARRGGYIVTPNIDHVVLAHQRPELRSVYAEAALSLADGQPLVWLARLLGQPVPARVSGSDLLSPLMQLAADRHYPVFFFGASPDASGEAARRLQARHHGLEIAGRDCRMWSPDDPTPPEDSPVVRRIQQSGARLVVLAMGAPKQEIWMHRHRAVLGHAVAIGLGASLDFAAGHVRRAPAWMSNAGLEWSYRLAQEPARLAHRYLVRDLAIVPIVARQWAHSKGQQ